jgi:hypothetical protein
MIALPQSGSALATRECNKCRRVLPMTEYHRDRSLRGDRRYTCKRCAVRAARASERGRYQATNGLSSVYRCMKRRCCDPRHRSYPRYGGRGITVCDKWLSSFESFYRWACDHGYRRGLQLDRIDNDGSYCPENCRWVSRAVNMRNNSNTKLDEQRVEVIRILLSDGIAQREIAGRFGISQSAVSNVHTSKTWKIAS